MARFNKLAAVSLAAIMAFSTPGFSQTQPDPHHTNQGQAATEVAPVPQGQQDMMMNMMSGMMNMMGGMMNMMGTTGSRQMGMGGGQAQQDMMMNMMSGMMNMMKMMGSGQQMGMGGTGMTWTSMADHFEGRIAFLRAELNITKDQEKAWNDFAAALHGAAERLKDALPMTMPGMANLDLSAQLDVQEKLLSARLEGIRGIKAALGPLYGVLTEDQRKLADNLLVGPMGFMGPGMMQGGMGNMMQGGMMSSQGNTQQ